MSAAIDTTDGERWEILLNGEETTWHDAGSQGSGGYVQAEAEIGGEMLIITVSYDEDGHTVSIAENPFGEGSVGVDVDPADDQPKRGTVWVVTEGEHEGATIELLPKGSELAGEANA